MNYSIHENDYNRLDAVRGQLALICGLLCANGVNTNHFDPSDLYDFLAAQCDSLKDVKKAMDARYEFEKTEDQMYWFDWAHLIRIVRGESAITPQGSEGRILAKLQAVAQDDPDFKMVLDEYLRASGDVFQSQAHATKKPMPDAPTNAAKTKRDRLAMDEGYVNEVTRPKKMAYPATEAIATGKILFDRSKEINVGVSAVASEFAIDISLGRKLVRVFKRFGDAKFLPLVEAAGNASKLFELLHVNDSNAKKLICGLSVDGISLKEIRHMTVWEIRKWLGLMVSRANTKEEIEALEKFRDSQPNGPRESRLAEVIRSSSVPASDSDDSVKSPVTL